MNETKRAHFPAILPIPAIVGSIVSVQGGAALAKGLFPALGATGTVGLGYVSSGNLPPPNQTGTFPINLLQACGPNVTNPSVLCAEPNADVNIRVGRRLYTTRANGDGDS